jgi:hypothetical protein
MSVKPHSEAREWIASALSGQAGLVFPDVLSSQSVLAQSEEEGVTALLYHVLQQAGRLDSLPQVLLASMQKINRKHIAADIATQSELSHLMSILYRHDLDFIMLKGEALSHSIYPQAHLRTKLDIDLMFASKDESERAWKVLQSENFERMLSQKGTFVGYQFVCHKEYSASFRIVFDIHNEITNYLWFNRRLGYQTLLENSCFIQIEQTNVRVLNTLHALIHACVHRITNISKGTADRLIWLYDIHLLSQRLSDSEWRALVTVCSDKDLSAIVLQGLQSSQQHLASSLRPSHINRLSANAHNERDPFTKKSRRIQMYWQDFMLNKGFANKLTQLRERVFPPADYMLKRYRLDSSRWLAFYYLKRIIAVIIRR